jgi:hypothetical protein
VRRRGENGCPVFLDEGLQDSVVAASGIDGGNKFSAHTLGVGAADVIAFQQNLIAPAHAHHLVAKLLNARGIISGADQDKDAEQNRAQKPKAITASEGKVAHQSPAPTGAAGA